MTKHDRRHVLIRSDATTPRCERRFRPGRPPPSRVHQRVRMRTK